MTTGGIVIIQSPGALTPDDGQPQDTPAPTEEPKEKAPVAVDFSSLSAINGDVAAWLYSEGTEINYPVVYRDNTFYLNHSFDGKKVNRGTLFIHEDNDPDFADENTLCTLLKRYEIDFIVLAGFLLMVPTFLIKQYHRRMLNIHPALLPKYGGKGMYGRHIHEAVKNNRETETGITIHYVSEVCDGGEIVFQATTPISSDDTPDDIAAAVHRLEHQYYPVIIEKTIRECF